MSDFGEKIGKITQDGQPFTMDRYDGLRYLFGRHLQESIVISALAAVNRRQVRVGGREDGLVCYDLYAEPPIHDKEEASRLATVIDEQLTQARERFPEGLMRSSEMDTFTPANPE